MLYKLAQLAILLRTRGVAVFSAYWDETWTEGTDVFAVAGYIFTPVDSLRFREQWQSALDSQGLRRFHMTDFLARRPPFDSWNERFRRQFFNRLVSIIHRNIRYQVVIVVSLDDLNALSDDDRRELKTQTEYSIAVSHFGNVVRDVLGRDAPVSYIYDGVGSSVGLSHVLNEFRVMQNEGRISSESTIERGNMIDNPELQAADILVHECTNEYSNIRRCPEKNPSRWGRVIFSLLDASRHREVTIDKDFLRSKIDYIKAQGGITIIEKRPKRSRRFRSPVTLDTSS